MSHFYDFLEVLPDAVITDSFEKHPGIFIRAALVEGEGKSVFIETVSGPNVPAPVYTLNLGGRGALVFDQDTFEDILSAGLALYEVQQGGLVAAPTDEA